MNLAELNALIEQLEAEKTVDQQLVRFYKKKRKELKQRITTSINHSLSQL